MKPILYSLVIACAATLAAAPALAKSARPALPPLQSAQASTDQPQLDQDFLHAATEGGLDEVTLGTLASQKSDNPEIQAFGRRMVRDHTRLNNIIGPIAERLGVTPPQKLAAQDQVEYDHLRLLPVADFNKAYLRLMVIAHRKDLHAFQHESHVAADPQLKRAVTSAATVIATHLRIATQLAEKLGIAINGPTHTTT
jgi:putative membrane protein